MRYTLASVSALLLSFGLFVAGNGLFNTLLGVRTNIEGFSTETIGVIMGAYYLGLFLGARYAVRVVAIAGHIRAFAAFTSVMSVSALLHVLWIDPIVWMLVRILSGFCMAGMVMVTESWLNERASNEFRGQLLSLYMITNYLGSGSGQFLLPLADPGEFQLFSLVSIIFSVALIPILLTRAKAPRPVAPAPVRIREMIRLAPVGIVGTFCAGMMNASIVGMGPVFTRGIGLPLDGTSLFMASVIIGGLMLQWPIGRLSDRIDRRWVLVGVTALTGLACVLMIAVVVTGAGGTTWPYFAIAVLYGCIGYTVLPICAAHVNDGADAQDLVRYSSALLVAFGTGAIIGPMLSAQVMAVFGPLGLFAHNGMVAGFVCLFTVYHILMHSHVGKRKSPFVPIPGSQYTSNDIYTAMRNDMDRTAARLLTGYRWRR